MAGRIRKVSYQKCCTPPHQKFEADAHSADTGGRTGAEGRQRGNKGDSDAEAVDVVSKSQSNEQFLEMADAMRKRTESDASQRSVNRKKSNESGSGDEHRELRTRHRNRSGTEEELHSQPSLKYGDAISRLNRFVLRPRISIGVTAR